MSDDLPMGWVETNLGKLGEWSSGGTPSRKQPEYYGGSIPWVKTGDLNNSYIDSVEEFITEDGLKNSSAKIFPSGTLLLAMYGATIGKTGVLKIEAATNQACGALIAEGFTRELIPFLRYFLIHKVDEFKSIGQGGAQPNISQTIIKQFPVSLPPLNEQRRIVDKLDRLGDRHRTARNELSHIPKLIVRYKQVVLAAAISGEMTADWREKKGKSQDWENITVAEIIDGIESGINIKCEERPPLPNESGIIKISAVTWGKFDDAKSKTVSCNQILPESTRIKEGDFLISRANTLELVGSCVIVENVERSVFLSDKVLRVLVNEKYKKWLLYWLRSINGRTQIEQLASGNQLSMRNLTQSNLKSIRLRLPNEDERDEIVNRIEKLFKAIERIEQEHQKASALLDRLEQTTLAKAFRGELVPQDPNDEPAAILLERIRRERPEQPKTKTGKSRRKPQTESL
jgi:type I restriction enzyme S subunit